MGEMFKKTYLWGYYSFLVILLILGIISLFHIDDIKNFTYEQNNKNDWRWCNKYQEVAAGNISEACLNDCRELFDCNASMSGNYRDKNCVCNNIPLSNDPYYMWSMKVPTGEVNIS